MQARWHQRGGWRQFLSREACKQGALACASALFARYNESLVICQVR